MRLLSVCWAVFSIAILSLVLLPCIVTAEATDSQSLIDINKYTENFVPSAPHIKVREGAASNWAGYAIATSLTSPQKNSVTRVSGSWTVPSLSCTNTTTYSSNWIGMDGYANSTVEQTGTEQDCFRGQASYYAWYEMYPKGSAVIKMDLHAGDNMSAEVKYVGNKFVLTLNNLTTGKQFSTTQSSALAKRQSAEWIVEAPWLGKVLPLANFGTTGFSNAEANINDHTGSISDSSWKNDSITMINPKTNAVKASTSALSGDGASFSTTWQSSN